MELPRYVLDSSVIINQLNSKVDIDAFFTSLPKCRRFISGMTDVEALSKPGMTDTEMAEARALLRKFESVNLWPEIKEEAASIRRGTKMKTPDAVIAATSIVLGATCLSNDENLLKLKWPGYTVKTIKFSQE